LKPSESGVNFVSQPYYLKWIQACGQVNDSKLLEHASFSILFLIFANYNFPYMKNNTLNESRKDYQTPSLRFIETDLEMSLLQSNLEPIGGGDDPDIDW
jgi:hypothetical protein